MGIQYFILSELHLSSAIVPESYLPKENFSLWKTNWYEKL